jgi:hypothetical protein
MAEME